MAYRGVFPVAPTVFHDDGTIDLDGQKRVADFMIEAGSHGICILANWSEQFALTDQEREQVMDAVLEHVAGRVPVIVTTTHFGSQICADCSRRAAAAGAAMVMVMPPYHGATIRAPESAIFEFYRRVSDAIDIPIMIQDAPVSGTTLSVPLLARMAREIANVSYFKIEMPRTADKLRDLIAQGGEAIVGPWDGEEAITLLAESKMVSTGEARKPETPNPASEGPSPRTSTFSSPVPAMTKPAMSVWAPVPASLRADKLMKRLDGVPVSAS